MSESLSIIEGTKEERYQNLLPQIESLLTYETDLIANMANICAALNEQFRWFWTGFYLVKEANLVVGPFQGPIACTRIARGKGVCGSSWVQGKTIIVEDVQKFPEHIACSSLSRSEIVVPIIRKEEVRAVLDIDSNELSGFDEIDQKYLERLVNMISFD
jgi:GAF domain-containing protein